LFRGPEKPGQSDVGAAISINGAFWNAGRYEQFADKIVEAIELFAAGRYGPVAVVAAPGSFTLALSLPGSSLPEMSDRARNSFIEVFHDHRHPSELR